MWPFTKSPRIQRELDDMRKEFDTLKVLAAQPLVQSVRANKLASSLHEAEFKVFSQFGDDGIIQYLVHRLAPLPDSFVEFGVENYRESNTRFLLLNNNSAFASRNNLVAAQIHHLEYVANSINFLVTHAV